jgi:putative hemolysin
MDDYGFNIALVGVLMLVNALFAGSEIALISLREGQLRQLDRAGGRRARTLVKLARDPNRFLATIQVGITLAGYLASATAAVTLAEPLVPLLGFFGGAAKAMAITLVTLVLAFVNLVIGELAPKRLAMQYAQRWAMVVARPLNALSTASRPVVWVLGKATDLIVRMLGGNPQAAKEQLTPDELMDLVVGHRGLNPEQRRIIMGGLEIHGRLLREVLVPRGAVFMLPADMPIDEARRALAKSGHSRAPVVRENHLDDVVGIVQLRDLLGDDATLTDLAVPAMLFPDSVRVTDALRRFKAERQQFALVVDEHGAVAGMVTLEDLLEEVVGEIYDETDEDVLAAQPAPDGTRVLPGTFPIHDLRDIGVELADAPEGDYATIAGLILIVLGRIPTVPGDRVRLTNWTIEVTRVAHHAITEVRLTPRHDHQTPPEQSTDAPD